MFGSRFGACLLVVGAAACGPGRAASEAPAAVPEYDLQGHRGARGLAPENTLPSFNVALYYGVDTLELDLHLSADGVPVVWHDPVIEASKCDRAGDRVRALTAVELRALVCDRNPDPTRFPHQTSGSRPPEAYGIVTLAEVFEFVEAAAADGDRFEEARALARRVRFNIETKRDRTDPKAIDDDFDGVSPGPFEKAIVDVVREYQMTDRVTVQSFDHRSLWAVRRLAPEIELAALTEDVPDFAALHRKGARVWSPFYGVVSKLNIAAAHRAGLRVIPWTVNSQAGMGRMLHWGADGFITDRPDLAP